MPKKKVVRPLAQNPQRDEPRMVKKDLREIFRNAFDTLGGAAWLVRFVNEDPQNARTFVQAIARLMPLEVTGKDGGALTVFVKTADGAEREVNMGPRPIEGEATRVLN